MALSSFLNIDGYDIPCPDDGFSYTITTTVDAGRNANNEVIGQRIGRDLYKLDQLKWTGLDAQTWESILSVVNPFFVTVTFEDYRTGGDISVQMYPGDRQAVPLFVDETTHKVLKYKECSFNLIDCGLPIVRKR